MQLKLFFIFLVLSAWGTIRAQETIIEALETPSTNEGIIEIKSNPSITALLGKPSLKITSESGNYDIIKVNGYRIQIFMGNDPKKSRAEAFDKQNLIRSVFPDIETYVDYDAPNWKTLAGDFVMQEEASLFKEILQREFPQFGKEMYVVANKVNIPVEKE
ncbi:MAG: hypothetical protein LBP72_08300 [Dysgonamonadaceae bacterium]|jgi:hypothetical protein|nr:hypothetical protein [Dysgonamonadaceae bacterium]